MQDRFNALGKTRRRRIPMLRGAVLAREHDAELDAFVDEAARQTQAPIALVSLVLDRTQFFRAQRGLPPELVEASGTDRDVSFCQLAVRENAPLVVENAPEDERVPQQLVKDFGIRAYLGVPLRFGEDTLGTLCVIDTKSRTFSEEEQLVLKRLSEQVTHRLAEMAGLAMPDSNVETTTTNNFEVSSAVTQYALVQAATSPALLETRNAMCSIEPNADALRFIAAELGPITRIAKLADPEARERCLRSLSSAGESVDEISEVSAEIEVGCKRVVESLEAIEGALGIRSMENTLDACVQLALLLARHATKIAGGVVEDEIPEIQLAASATECVALIAVTLATLSGIDGVSQSGSGLSIGAMRGDGETHLHVRCLGPSDFDHRNCEDALRSSLDYASSKQVHLERGSVILTIPTT
ncbi:MAG: GAF domain-containing protein [Myxococcota bacterium]